MLMATVPPKSRYLHISTRVWSCSSHSRCRPLHAAQLEGLSPQRGRSPHSPCQDTGWLCWRSPCPVPLPLPYTSLSTPEQTCPDHRLYGSPTPTLTRRNWVSFFFSFFFMVVGIKSRASTCTLLQSQPTKGILKCQGWRLNSQTQRLHQKHRLQEGRFCPVDHGADWYGSDKHFGP